MPPVADVLRLTEQSPVRAKEGGVLGTAHVETLASQLGVAANSKSQEFDGLMRGCLTCRGLLVCGQRRRRRRGRRRLARRAGSPCLGGPAPPPAAPPAGLSRFPNHTLHDHGHFHSVYSSSRNSVHTRQHHYRYVCFIGPCQTQANSNFEVGF